MRRWPADRLTLDETYEKKGSRVDNLPKVPTGVTTASTNETAAGDSPHWLDGGWNSHCDPCITAVHCAHNKRCLAECVPDDLATLACNHNVITCGCTSCFIGRANICADLIAERDELLKAATACAHCQRIIRAHAAIENPDVVDLSDAPLCAEHEIACVAEWICPTCSAENPQLDECAAELKDAIAEIHELRHMVLEGRQ